MCTMRCRVVAMLLTVGAVLTVFSAVKSVEEKPSSAEYDERAYAVIDFQRSSATGICPLSYLSDVPAGGWTDEYKTGKLVLRHVKPGWFVMGSPAIETGRTSQERTCGVSIMNDYYIGVFEITQRQWELVMGTRPSRQTNALCYATRPVDSISYDMIRGKGLGKLWPPDNDVDKDSFIGALREKTGLKTLDLPSEAEWEYACRAGTTSAFNNGGHLSFNGQKSSDLSALGRYCGNVEGRFSWDCDTRTGTAAVGSYQPNAWGLYDMHGNLCEWCLDKYLFGTRALRGGAFSSPAEKCRSAYRDGLASNFGHDYCGVRVAWHLGAVNHENHETVNGLEWRFSVCNGEVSVGGEEQPRQAVPKSVVGHIDIPSKLGGLPVTRIGNGAFEDCCELKSVTIPPGVTCIGFQAFSGCRALTSVSIPSSVTNIFGLAFSHCDGLTTFSVGVSNGMYKTENGLLLSKDGAILVAGINGEITIPNKVMQIEVGAFSGKRNLVTVKIPANVKNIGSGMFSNCKELTTVTMSEGVTNIGSYAFAGCDKLTSITIPAGVTSIGSSAFSGCDRLMSVTIPPGVTSIGDCAFSNCRVLTSVTIPASVINIGKNVFFGCKRVSTVDVCKSNAKYKSANGFLLSKDGKKLISGRECADGDLTIPASVMSIGENAFCRCKRLTSVTIPGTVTNVGALAFFECSRLTSVTISSGVMSIGKRAFFDCRRFKTIKIPSSVAYIDEGAFRWCYGLTNIVFEGNAPQCMYQAFDHVNPDCTATVKKGTKGWCIQQDGTWHGLKLKEVEE